IVGAGATGVELAAEVNHAAEVLMRYGLDEIKPANVDITVIEAAPRVLPALSEKISQGVHHELSKLGIHVLTNEMVTEIDGSGINTKSGKHIPAQIKVWSA